jgi:hypothetical protein
MNTLKRNLGPSWSSVQSGGQSTPLRVSQLVGVALLAGFILLCGGAKASTNVLINPGAETGDLTGWNVSLTGYIYVVSTNGVVPGTTGENFLAHSGKYTFQLFNTTANSSYIYQDFAAIAGSQWSGSCYAICYASNYFQAGANAHLQVVFYDATNGVVPYPNPLAGGGTYGSVFLDPQDLSGLGVTWAIIPPMAVDASGWLNLLATNLYDTDPATEASYDPNIQPTTATLTAPPGTAKVRYQIEFDNSVTDGGDVYWDDCDLEKLNFTDPDITNPPVALTVYAGAAAQFSVGAIHTQAGEKLHYQWQLNGTNLPPNGVNDISSSTTAATMSFTNCQSVDAGLYDVVVTVTSTTLTNSIRSVPESLTVLTLSPLQKVNALGVNSGFESAPVWLPWNIFNGCNFASAANFYGTSTTPVNVLDGSEVAIIGANGDRDNGFWNAIPAAPGTVWKAGGWAYISSLNDFIDGNTCRLQIWFKGTYNGATVPGTSTYESFKMYGLGYTNADAQYTNIDTSSPNNGLVDYHAQLPRDQWCYLAVSNVVNNGGIGLGDDLPYNTLPNGDFMVPTNAGTAYINFQVYEYCPQATDTPPPQADLGGTASDAVYWDDMELIQVLPVTNLTATVSGGNVNLSFAAGPGLDYTVLYKTNLTDAAWNVLSNNIAAPLSWQTNTAATTVTYPLTVSDSISGQHSRFYRVQSQ